jgi:TonB family protein
MMSAYANGLQKPESFDSYVRKFRVICVMHGIPFGSAANLPLFLQKLINDRPLAMDFWGFVSKLSDREGGELSDDQLLAVVVEGVAKGEIPPDDQALKRTVDDLRSMLAGVDVHDPGQLEPEPFSRDAPFESKEAWEPSPRHMRLDPVQSPAPSANSSTTPPPTIPPQLDEALHRLELTNLELKHHLEAIDKRMSQLEPHLEGVPIAGDPQSEQLIHRPVGQQRLVLDPAPQHADLPFTRESGDLPSRGPLESYSESSGYGRAVSALVLVVILGAAAFAGYRYREPLQQQGVALIEKIQSRIRSTPPPQQTASQDAATGEVAPASQPQPNQATPHPSSPQKAFAPPPHLGNPAQPTSAGSHAPAPASDSNGARRSVADRVAALTAPAQPDGISSSEIAGAVRVAPAVMESKLVDSRVPAYPDSAKIQGVEGSVVMQAIISRDGTVKHVHVIEGDSRLRNSATEAVYKWRYRPYMVNGQPVDVLTTITVDFDLDR